MKKPRSDRRVKKVMQELNVEDIDFKKTSYYAVGILAGSIALTVALTVFFKWIGLACGLAVAAVAIFIFYKEIEKQQTRMVEAYKKLGATKEEYIESFNGITGNNALKKILISVWDKVPEPEKTIAVKGKAQKVNQSRQNKKKRKYKKKK